MRTCMLAAGWRLVATHVLTPGPCRRWRFRSGRERAHLPCSSPRLVAMLSQAPIVARAVISLAGNGSTLAARASASADAQSRAETLTTDTTIKPPGNPLRYLCRCFISKFQLNREYPGFVATLLDTPPCRPHPADAFGSLWEKVHRCNRCSCAQHEERPADWQNS